MLVWSAMAMEEWQNDMICGVKLVGGICNTLRTYLMMNTKVRVIILIVCVIHLVLGASTQCRLRISLFSLVRG